MVNVELQTKDGDGPPGARLKDYPPISRSAPRHCIPEGGNHMPFTLLRQDITKMKVDAIVNAANTALRMGGGVCGAIFKEAGVLKLQTACADLSPIATGQAVITPGFALPAKYIIHTAGPVYQDGRHNEEQLLGDCYRNSLKLALDNNCASIAFPLISSGIYGYPKGEALAVAIQAIRNFLTDHELDVYLTVFDKSAYSISRQLFAEVESYIDEHYAAASLAADSRRLSTPGADRADPLRTLQNLNALHMEEALTIEAFQGQPAERKKDLSELMGNLDEPFSATLLKLIDHKGRSDVEVYRRANLDRKLFSKIRTNANYMPSKRTALALCVALELSLRETLDLLKRAGYSLSHAQKADVIVEYFILNHKYDLYAINEVLFQYDQPLLGG